MQPFSGHRVEPAQFLVQGRRAAALGLAGQLLAQRPVGRRAFENSVQESAQVKRSSADEERRPPARGDLFHSRPGGGKIVGKAVRLTGFHHVHQMKGHGITDSARRFGRADIQPAVHFDRVHRDEFRSGGSRQFNGDGPLAGGGLSRQNSQRGAQLPARRHAMRNSLSNLFQADNFTNGI